ncbi:Gfo/Idh/MocA family oxidoreductase [Candidatus Protofrankia californiensis]|uniref:Gfo/Idh/MocA family oxidoreductase n=1 Tax=Candidatus Protofrankia californiensis TaxID=1839754 RepID=UPI001041BC95|nr:Gfo/Idh/MocA family oxidoreductase [Candidatus Protofrankia californiensis]
MTTVPELVAPRDPAGAREWRERRRDTRRLLPDLPGAMALVTDGSDRTTAPVLRDAGVDVVGLLAPEPLESLAWAAEAEAPRAYADLVAMLSDEIEAVCIEMAPPGSDVIARRSVEAGLHVLLSRPMTADPDALRAVADLAEESDLAHVVAMDGRAWPAAWHVQASMASLGRITQVTMLAAPAGQSGRAEIIDLVVRWCGEVLAVCANPDAMPAARLTADAPVTLALLSASGATALVNERPDGRLETTTITICGTGGRMVVQGRRVLRQDADGMRDLLMREVPGMRPGLIEATYDVVRVTELNDPALVRGATFHDLLTIARLLSAADASEESGCWVEL